MSDFIGFHNEETLYRPFKFLNDSGKLKSAASHQVKGWVATKKIHSSIFYYQSSPLTFGFKIIQKYSAKKFFIKLSSITGDHKTQEMPVISIRLSSKSPKTIILVRHF